MVNAEIIDMEKQNEYLVLDVSKIFRDKSPSFYKWVPRCLITGIEKLIHQEEMNQFLKTSYKLKGVDFANAVLDLFKAKINLINSQNIPQDDIPYIVVSNHPLGGLDGIALIALFGKYRQDIKFPVNDLLMQISPMQDVFIPVNKHGLQSRQAIIDMENSFAASNLMIYFPAGLCSRKIKGEIQDKEWKDTIFKKALKYKRPIIPVYFDGRNSMRFYNLSKIRTLLGVKFNLEMLFLPDEMYRQTGKTINVVIGEPISVDVLKQWENPAHQVRQICYGLKRFI